MTKLEAIAILDGFKYNPLFNEQQIEAFDMAISALEKNESAEKWYKLLCEKLDSAEYKGEWVREDIHSSWKCSRCNTYAIEDFEHCEIRSPFCPNCGAKMDKGET